MQNYAKLSVTFYKIVIVLLIVMIVVKIIS